MSNSSIFLQLIAPNYFDVHVLGGVMVILCSWIIYIHRIYILICWMEFCFFGSENMLQTHLYVYIYT
jgi:hypothetical protein